MKKYFRYLLYVLEHKKNVFVECWKEGLYIHAFTHDLSKFLPCEFFAYARYDFQNKERNTAKTQQDFKIAWQHHIDNNKHHWNYWHERNLDMHTQYIKQMICDWKAMSRKFGSTAQAYYLKNYMHIELSYNSRLQLENMLGLKDNMYHTYCDTLEEMINKQSIGWWNTNFGFLKERYGVDLLEVLNVETRDK